MLEFLCHNQLDLMMLLSTGPRLHTHTSHLWMATSTTWDMYALMEGDPLLRTFDNRIFTRTLGNERYDTAWMMSTPLRFRILPETSWNFDCFFFAVIALLPCPDPGFSCELAFILMRMPVATAKPIAVYATNWSVENNSSPTDPCLMHSTVTRINQHVCTGT